MSKLDIRINSEEKFDTRLTIEVERNTQLAGYLFRDEGLEEAVQYLGEGEGEVSVSGGYDLFEGTANHLDGWLQTGKKLY